MKTPLIEFPEPEDTVLCHGRKDHSTRPWIGCTSQGQEGRRFPTVADADFAGEPHRVPSGTGAALSRRSDHKSGTSEVSGV
jgi:hypothetical protein